jgi:hypothetical protein
MHPLSSVIPIVMIPLAELEVISSLQISLLHYSSLFLFVEALSSATCSSNSTCSCSQSFVPMS